MEIYYEIAGVRIRVTSEKKLFDSHGILEGFVTAAGDYDYSYNVDIVSVLPPPKGELYYSDAAMSIYSSDGAVMRYSGGDGSKALLCLVKRGRERELYFSASRLFEGVTPKLLLAALELEHLLVSNGAVLLHASYIEHNGKAILFTAPSETGKSTQAELWCRYAGASLVNGDRAAIVMRDGAVFACGVPFSGSSSVRRNVTAPIKAIVYLEQSKENRVTRLNGSRAFMRVWEGCTVNVWYPEDIYSATKCLEKIVSQTPIFHLACRPDAEAVETLKKIMEAEQC